LAGDWSWRSTSIPFAGHVVQQRLSMREWRVHGHERWLRVEQSPQGVEVSGVNRVRGRFEPGVHCVVPVGERVCPVHVPVILADGDLGRVRIETGALHVAHDVGEAEDLDSRGVAARNGVTQQLGLQSNPALDRNLGPVHHWSQEAEGRHRAETTNQGAHRNPRRTAEPAMWDGQTEAFGYTSAER
jgi:hypothetical protein